MFRFVLIYSVLMGVFATFFYVEFSEGSFFDDYLSLNARWSAGLLRAAGYEATPRGTLIIAPKATLDIKRGCDAVLATALFVFGIVAFPSRWRDRLPAMVIGAIALLSLNFVRIISLYLIKLYAPGAFHVMHVQVWQAVFILVPIVAWFAWAVWARKKSFGDKGDVAG